MRYRARSFFESFRFALAGLVFMWRTQRNFRVHVIAGTTALSLALLLDCTRVEIAILALVSSGVMAFEMVNTAIENAVDLATHRKHPLAKAAKDVAAGAVLLSALTALGAGALILGPRAWSSWVLIALGQP
ncbi:MAG: diacylglycerol kinase family protein [Candidatus Sericytochromatia bacterium]|nr:diacylglycerol kinase family protein [Candidatus Sericytochromatia bacterium]